MKYIKLETLEYPRFEGDIRLEYPDIAEDQTGDSFPCPDTYAKVNCPDAPAYDDATQTFDTQPPTLVDGIWTVQYVIRDLTQQELADIQAIKDLTARRISEMNNTHQSGSEPNAL